MVADIAYSMVHSEFCSHDRFQLIDFFAENKNLASVYFFSFPFLIRPKTQVLIGLFTLNHVSYYFSCIERNCSIYRIGVIILNYRTLQLYEFFFVFQLSSIFEATIEFINSMSQTRTILTYCSEYLLRS